MKNKITIVGRGMNPAQHLSIAALRALQRADKIIGIEPEEKAWQEFRKEFNLPEIEDVSRLYQNGKKDTDNYNIFIQYVLQLSKNYSRLVLLVAGHPRLGVSFIETLSKQISENTEIEVIEGLSSFDVMINDLALDPLERGSTLLDANRMILFQYQLEPSLNYFLYHVCSVGNPKTDFNNTAAGNHLEILKNYLLKSFQADKKMFLCKASSGNKEGVEKIQFELSNLEQIRGQIDFRTSIYIPAEKPNSIDRKYLELLRN